MARKTMQKELLLEGLSCANCAGQIEKRVQRLEGMKSANLNYATQRLVIEATDQKDLPGLAARAAEIAREIEPDLRVVDQQQTASDAPGSASGKNSFLIAVNDPVLRWRMIGAVLGLILFVTAFIADRASVLRSASFIAAYLLSGSEVIWKALRKILKGQIFDEHFLMTVATIGALVLGELGEAAAVMLFYQAGTLMQDLAVGKSRRSIGALLDIRPDHANLQAGEGIRHVKPEQVKVGERIVIKPGERIPLDGIVREGRSLIDTAALTGEPMPRVVVPGQEVFSGSINQTGSFVLEVTREYQDSMVARILDLVQNASSRKAPTENFISKFARFYSPLVVGAAALLAFLPPLLIPGATLASWLNRALVFLVISCPCALVISIPLGFFGGIGGAARHGILFKGSNYLEALNRVDTVVFDKTGTLTRGIFHLSGIFSVTQGADSEVLGLAARAESFSSHPIAQSVLHAYGRRFSADELAEMSDHEEITGQGTSVMWRGRKILAGSGKLLAKAGIETAEPKDMGVIIHVAYDGRYKGYLVIADELKPGAGPAIAALRRLHLQKILLFTGDSQAAGNAIGQELGLSAVHGELLPDRKVSELEALEREKKPGSKILFVGDGINDAPALARADVGIAMGGLASDAAIEAADIVIMSDEPGKVAQAVQIARQTRRIVWQNILFAFLVKGVFLALGAAGATSLWLAVFADVGVAVLAVFNSLRVLRLRLIDKTQASPEEG